MKILHTADLHLGQIIYQNYERSDEHRHFFRQLSTWCREEKPDALLLSGDVFDIQQPSASTKKVFTDYFVSLHNECPGMTIVITAGNHDSASRLQADSAIWGCAGIHLVGVSPAIDAEGDWQEQYIVRLEQGYIVAMPFARGERREQLQSILDRIAAENSEGKPVVMMSHTAVTGLDITGHSFDIGTLETQDTSAFGSGYDYLALGHIHKPQTLGHSEDAMLDEVVYPSPVARYSGSPLHVSCDEKYPHTVSVVELDRRGGAVKIRQLRIDELRHFYELPLDGSSFADADQALAAIREFCNQHPSGYIRLRMDRKAPRPSDFTQQIYDILSATGDEVRYNPKIIETGDEENPSETAARPTFEVATLQQMLDPMRFVEQVIGQFPQLDLEEVREDFVAVREEILRMREEEAASEAEAARKAEAVQKERAAREAAREADREARRAAKEEEKAARMAAREAEKEAKRAAREAEKAAKKAAREAVKAAKKKSDKNEENV